MCCFQILHISVIGVQGNSIQVKLPSSESHKTSLMNELALAQLMAWWCQATCHNLNKFLQNSMMPNRVTRPQRGSSMWPSGAISWSPLVEVMLCCLITARKKNWYTNPTIHQSHPTKHHFVTEMCTLEVTKWSFVGYLIHCGIYKMDRFGDHTSQAQWVN